MAPSLSTLSLALAHRLHEDLGDGVSRSARTFLDFIVDARSLGHEIKNAGYDLVSVFTADWASSYREDAVRRLLFKEDSDFPNGRRSLYVCSECGDLGCGAVTIILDKKEETVVWRDFGYENTYEDIVQFKKLMHLGPFQFSLESYQKTIESALTLITQTPDNLR
jgi:hypothetical protein